MFLTFFYEKNFSRSLNVCEAVRQGALQAASAYKRREFWRETHTPPWLLIGHIIFLTRKYIVRDFYWTYHFFDE